MQLLLELIFHRNKYCLSLMNSLLKIWNHNKFTGIIGIFNCQGAGLWPSITVQTTTISEETYLTGHVSPCDVEYLEDVAGDGWNGDCAVYSFTDGNTIGFLLIHFNCFSNMYKVCSFFDTLYSVS